MFNSGGGGKKKGRGASLFSSGVGKKRNQQRTEEAFSLSIVDKRKKKEGKIGPGRYPVRVRTEEWKEIRRKEKGLPPHHGRKKKKKGKTKVASNIYLAIEEKRGGKA